MKPDFIGIGAQKAGSTWLNSQLKMCSDVWLPPVKELHYFDGGLRQVEAEKQKRGPWETNIRETLRGHREKGGQLKQRLRRHLKRRDFGALRWEMRWKFGRRNDEWYCRLFDEAGSDRVCGEITPEYAVLAEEAVHRMARLNPRLKVILFVRDPLDRAWSALRFAASRGVVNVDLGSADEVGKFLVLPGTLRRSDYLETLRIYARVLPPEQILIGFFDAITEAPAELMAGICRFLEVKEFRAREKRLQRVVNRSPARKLAPGVIETVRGAYEPEAERQAAVLGGYAVDWLSRLRGGGSGVEGSGERRPAVRLLADCHVEV